MEVVEGSDQKNQTSSPTGWLCMSIWRMSSGRTKSHKAKKQCVFQVSQSYLGFCPNPKHFIVNFEENTVKMLKNQVKYSEKCNIYIKYFCKIKCYADRPYLVFSELKHTYISFWPNVMRLILFYQAKNIVCNNIKATAMVLIIGLNLQYNLLLVCTKFGRMFNMSNAAFGCIFFRENLFMP